MPEKFCPKCGERSDEAKAFCQACGHAFVEEEQRTDRSAYEQADNTMQMGQTMYNAMLSDMGLNLKRSEPEKRVEVLKPVAVQAPQVLHPVAGTAPVPPAASAHRDEPRVENKSDNKFWLITIIVALGLLVILLAAVLLVGLYLYFRAGTH